MYGTEDRSTNPREINQAVTEQAMRGTCSVRTPAGFRVIQARTVKGQLQAKTMSGRWQPVMAIYIER